MTRRNNYACLIALAALLVRPHAAWAEARQTQDYIVGNGTAGPYTLSWMNILPGMESVTVNDVPMAWGVDYTLDPRSGTLTFAHPLPAQAGATIQYDYDTKQAQPQGNGLNLPLATPLNSNVSLVGSYNHAPTDGQKLGALNVGLNGGWQGPNDGKLTTHLLFVPAMTGADASAAPNGLGRMGFDASGQTRLGKPLTLAFGFSRAGLGVGNQGSGNWQAGVQKTTLNAAFTPTQQIQATFGYAQTDPTNGHGSAQSQIAAALALSPNSRMQFKTGLTQTQGGGSGPAQTLTASADVKPTGQADLAANYTQKDATDKAGDAQTLNLKAALSAGKAISLVATDTQTSSGQDGGITQTQTFAATVKPLDSTELDAAYSEKDTPGKGSDTQNINVKAALGTGKPLSLTASLDQSVQGTQDTDAQAVRLSLAPQAALQVNTGLSLRQSPTANTQATTVDGKMQPWAFLLLSGGYQWRTVTPAQTGGTVDGNYDSSSAQVTLAPHSALHLVGTYAQNPDAADGTPQRLARHGVGLEARLGALSLTGGCDWSQQYQTPTTGTSIHVGLGLRFSADTQLTGGYKQDLTGVGEIPAGTSAYTVGLTRNLGERFNLSLNGTMQQAVGPGSAAPANVTASANLGMKF